MKWWIKLIIVVTVLAVIVVFVLSMMMGMSKEYELKVSIDGEVREYAISRSIGAYMANKWRYSGSLVDEYTHHIADGLLPHDALIHMSPDFATVLEDIEAGERKKVESKVLFNTKSDTLFDYSLGTDGRKMSAGVYESLLWAIDEHGVANELYVYDRAKSIDELKTGTKLLARFTTEYATSGENRRENIRVATAYIDGTIVEPNEVFSFNKTVGARTPERGFREANVIVAGEYVKGYGGGVCQVSTTLYNAWVLAGGGVEYATSHSLPPHYIDMSRDAMVASTNDMLLQNNGTTPLYVRAYCGIDDVTFEIYGLETTLRYDILSEVIGTIDIETKIVGDVDAVEYIDTVIDEGREGYNTRAYLITYSRDGVEIDRHILRYDTYMSQPKIVERRARTNTN